MFACLQSRYAEEWRERRVPLAGNRHMVAREDRLIAKGVTAKALANRQAAETERTV